jgi:hypothetical protein
VSRRATTPGDFWPRNFDFTDDTYIFERIATLPANLFNSISAAYLCGCLE